MTKISMNHVVKRYGSVTIIPDLSLEIQDGELFTLLGPSGCGKTTLLRMIAGFNSIEGGSISFDDKCIHDMDPSKRNIGMVFQNYAIFPNMTVRGNAAFGLKNRNMEKGKIAAQTDEFLKLMQMHEYAERMPDRLSGGQQQRVALARALVIRPEVLLMDEPLSNLDAKLRLEMRQVIRHTQKDVGITTVYVTHDQEEAMAISDKIAVMKGGIIQQVGTPKEIYQRPSNTFVAGFIGGSNMMKARITGGSLALNGSYRVNLPMLRTQVDQEVICSVRPEEFVISLETENGLKGMVKDIVYLGLNTHYFIQLECGDTVEVIQESSIDDTLQNGTAVTLQVKKEKINVFDASGNRNLVKGVIR